jgi:hypothetical protein
MEKEKAGKVVDGEVDLDSLIKAWKDRYGEIYELMADENEELPELAQLRIICKTPGRSELSRFIKDATAGDALKAQNNFVYGCLLYPDAAVLKQFVDKQPGLIVALGNELQSLTGTSQNFFMKKL